MNARKLNKGYEASTTKGKRAAIYCRLSKDDELQGESASIANQRDMLTAYCKTNGWEIVGVYQDDGYTGLNMDRPDLQRALEAARDHEFEIFVTKDECHHATAETYKKIIGYFEPEFLHGLTATPERLDNQDVFEMFDHNVPYELRLRDAIANDLVVPFKYYGIRDQLVDYGLSGNEERRMIAQMAKEDHCDFIANQIEKYRPQGKLKCLAFCRNVTHARMMCEALGERYRTAYLTGRNDIGERVRAYNDLQNDTHELEILFTVDILNEGVDIPGVNMVLFLRPTESTTIFIQQLGRGLRKYMNKEYVTVLDFIGNSYKRSVQIAFALGSLSENFVMEKRLMASLVKDNFMALGLTDYDVEIHIDDLSKEEILEYIDKENFNAVKYLKQDYFIVNDKNILSFTIKPPADAHGFCKEICGFQPPKSGAVNAKVKRTLSFTITLRNISAPSSILVMLII